MKKIIAAFIFLSFLCFNVFAQDFAYIGLEGHTSSVSNLVFNSDG